MRGTTKIKKVATIALIIAALVASIQLIWVGTLIFQIYEGVFGTQAEIQSIALGIFHGVNSSVEFLIVVDNPSHGSLNLNRIEIFLYLNDNFLYRYINYKERPIPPLSQKNISLRLWINELQALEEILEAIKEDRWGWSAQCELGFETPLGSFLRKVEY